MIRVLSAQWQSNGPMLPDPYLGIGEVGKLGGRGGGERTRSTDSSRALRRVHSCRHRCRGPFYFQEEGEGKGLRLGTSGNGDAN
jgi:hypothetical protein